MSNHHDRKNVADRFAQLLRARRKKLGISQRELAERSSVSKRTVESLEQAVGDGGAFITALALARALGMKVLPVDHLMPVRDQ